jgi:hypothetical protein
MFQDLVNIKKKLLDKYSHYEGKTPHGGVGDTDYKDGLLTGLAVALSTIDQLMESEDERMSREYGEKDKW